MREQDEEIHAVSQYLIDEIILAFGRKKTAGNRRLFNFFLNRVTTRLSSICVLTDRKIATEGFPAAVGWMAGHWVREVTTAAPAPSRSMALCWWSRTTSAPMISWLYPGRSTGEMSV